MMRDLKVWTGNHDAKGNPLCDWWGVNDGVRRCRRVPKRLFLNDHGARTALCLEHARSLLQRDGAHWVEEELL